MNLTSIDGAVGDAGSGERELSILPIRDGKEQNLDAERIAIVPARIRPDATRRDGAVNVTSAPAALVAGAVGRDGR